LVAVHILYKLMTLAIKVYVKLGKHEKEIRNEAGIYEKLIFTTPYYCFRRVPMGLTDAQKLEVIEIVRKEMEKLLPLKDVATKQDIKLLVDLVDRRFEDVNKRFEELLGYVDKRFEAVDRRFEDVNKRFEDVNKRFEDMNKRFDELYRISRLSFVILSILISIFTLIVSILITLR